MIKKEHFIQFLKYGIVGVLNTFVTLFAILICKSVLGLNPYLSNAIGYCLGLLNSFLWNRSWVFKAHSGRWHSQAIRFAIGFGLCYGIQLLVVWAVYRAFPKDYEMTLSRFVVSGYGIATIVGNVVYTLANFIYNKFVTFHTKHNEKMQ